MTGDRIRAAWSYANREIWSPLFSRFRAEHPDLPIEIIRFIIERPAINIKIFTSNQNGVITKEIFHDSEKILSSTSDATHALRRLKAAHFQSGRAIATLIMELSVNLNELYENIKLNDYYTKRVEIFFRRHKLPYRIDTSPLKITSLIHEDMDGIYGRIQEIASDNPILREALEGFENAWDRQSVEWTQINGKDALSNLAKLAEGAIVLSVNKKQNEFSKALSILRNGECFPSDDYINIFDRMYTFINNYPNIRHSGDVDRVKRELSRDDVFLISTLLIYVSVATLEYSKKEGE